MEDEIENLLEKAYSEHPSDRRHRSPRDGDRRDNGYSKSRRERSPPSGKYRREEDRGSRGSSDYYQGFSTSSSRYSPPPPPSHADRRRDRYHEESDRRRDDRRRSRSRSPRRDYRDNPPRKRKREKASPTESRSSGNSRHGAAPPPKSVPARVKALQDPTDDPEFAKLLSQEDKDSRTVFCMQLSPDISSRDLHEFFRDCGRVSDIRIIGDRRRRSSKGVAYIEFEDISAVTQATQLSGKKLLGIPIVVQVSQAEKNRIYCNTSQTFHGGYQHGPMKLMVNNLHPEISEDMVFKVFTPYGNLDRVELVKDLEGKSKGYAYVYFKDKISGEKALKQLDGFELVKRQLRVSLVADQQPLGTPSLDNEDMDRRGIELGPTGRISLMAKLAKGCGMDLPESAKKMLYGSPMPPGDYSKTQTAPGAINSGVLAPRAPGPGVVPSQCFMLSNMFGPDLVMSPEVIEDITSEVLLALEPHGGAVYLYVDKYTTQGNVFLKSPSISQGEAAVNALHKRFFSGRQIEAAFIQPNNFHNTFPQSINASQILKINK